MRRFRKIAGLMLVLVMALAMSMTVMAADTNTYTITIENETDGYTYIAYQIFKGDLSGSTLSNIEFGSALSPTDQASVLLNYSSILDGTTYAYSAAGLAEALVDGASNGGIDVTAFAEYIAESYTLTPAKTFTYSDTAKNYTADVVGAGYYLIKNTAIPSSGEGTVYSNYILEVVKSITVTPKSGIPTVDKKVSNTSASIDEEVTYTLTATLPSTLADYSTYQLVFNDTLSKGLTLVTSGSSIQTSDVTVTVYPSASDAENGTNGVVVDSSNGSYTVTAANYSGTNSTYEGGTVLTVGIGDVNSLYSDSASTSKISVTKDSVIVVTYKAKLNGNAVSGSTGNPNEVNVTYSNNPNGSETGTTTTDQVVTFTFELDVTKVDGNDNTKVLENAEFKLYYTDGNSITYYAQVDENTGKITGWTTDSDQASTLKSDSYGIFKIIGLGAGTYYLEETKAPDGYNKLSSSITIVISATYTDTDSDGDYDEINTLTVTVDGGTPANGNTSTGAVSVTVENNSGSTMPSTGGIGTTIFYVVGPTLILLAVVLLITRSRMRRREEE